MPPRTTTLNTCNTLHICAAVSFFVLESGHVHGGATMQSAFVHFSCMAASTVQYVHSPFRHAAALLVALLASLVHIFHTHTRVVARSFTQAQS
jgi:hypothetical protein